VHVANRCRNLLFVATDSTGTRTKYFEDLPSREFLNGLFHLFFRREAALTDDGPYVKELESGYLTPRDLLEYFVHSAEWSHLAPMTRLVPSLHYGRGVFIRSLPRATRILDIGGASSADPRGGLVMMGYPYSFEELVIVDLPSDQRHPNYQDSFHHDSFDTGHGLVSYRYHSMANLSGLPSHSFDLVYSGESIEHITRAEAHRLLPQIRRVLKPTGYLALDTPNRRLTRLQQPTVWLDPDHKYEYTHREAVRMLRGGGFSVRRSHGISYGAQSIQDGVFNEIEVATRRGLFDDVENCYLLAYICQPSSRYSLASLLHRLAYRLAGPGSAAWRLAGQAKRRWGAHFQRRSLDPQGLMRVTQPRNSPPGPGE
jgi:SAM-dependent methyltransferase